MFRKHPILAVSLALAAVWGPSAHAGDLVVSAAASLTNAFKDVAQAYEKEHAGTKVILNFGASDVLLQQIVKGAPADVFASADQKAMDKAVEEKAVKPESRVDFAANQIVLIVPTDSKANITALKDLTRDDVKRIAYGNPASVPVGRYTQGALQAAGLWDAVQAKSVLAQNVRQSLDYVSRGEVDAGFVFATDAAVMPDKVKVAVRVPSQTPVTYPIAVTARDTAAKEAKSFVAYVMSPAGQEILSRYGFQKP
ncbi:MULTISPECIES: molybdate ABC transporter substrate-binding protein [Achromobacter]|jgi:molybdate transport system substrate-binding protein|uniref:Molybdate ABC transporter substrate-binding protein n=3 Tax=Achromobacter TaxID=222 RepID=A0A7T4B969_9BURK|nr:MULTISPECIES: molybdate ABC transporter substrate-binding protein [Achromobacter]EGP48108.1 molybdate ABC transporter periplasmic molybdate-binding protein [Achromobacter insuavis AXX-A]MBN9636997.1 molybdate ABC transporter substrate-binding protein [Achromobacter sp.]MCG2599103.1 molybdate ABC transporter substrate-binding protein [Achromobacter sp.]MCG2602806.1 molybdate ABC transporter substrate-binding protein [Achromobacter sp.]QQB37857.1 molybdate ABC transporter substrate-binding pr